MSERRIVLATGNAHKVREVTDILGPLGIAVPTPDAVGGLPDVIEDGDTFAANAIKKAASACAVTGEWALADDSGIEARALGGAPGVYSGAMPGRHAMMLQTTASWLQPSQITLIAMYSTAVSSRCADQMLSR